MAGRLSDADLDGLLHLSRLDATDDERARLKKQAENIIAYFDVLADIDTSGTEADYSSAMEADELRQDAAEPSLSTQQVKRISGNFLDGYFAVPKIIEGE